MSVKNFGAGVSGYLTTDGRAWETVAFLAGKPVLDRELALLQDVRADASQATLKKLMPSGWLSDDYLSTSDSVGAIYIGNTAANTLQVPSLQAHVNGWLISVNHTNVSGKNQLQLTAGPTGAGTQRADLVFLEVFRKLVPASPSTDGKSASSRIWQNGNVKTSAADDTTLNYADDTLDTNVNVETTRRVQIQYRLRAVAGVNLFAHPYGMDDPAVVANTVPASATAPNGTATAFTYVNQSANGDPGLWVAGSANPANGLGTVDGFMYAIPLLGLFRRNTAAFNRLTNHNGGVASPGPSDRPDGLFHDIIAPEDIVDLRSGVSPRGWALPEVLEKATNAIFDNTLRTEIVDTAPDGAGNSGTTVLRANEIGTTQTTAGPLIGQFDGIRRRFSDRAVLEHAVLSISAPGGGWVDGATVTINPTSLPVYPFPAFDWNSSAPAGARILDVVGLYWEGTAAGQKYIDALNPPPGTAVPTGTTPTWTPVVKSITGLGAVPRSNVSITFGAITSLAIGSTVPLYAVVLVAYPPAQGLQYTPTATYGNAGFTYTGALATTAPTSFNRLDYLSIDAPHREAQVLYVTGNLTATIPSFSSGTGRNYVQLPERADSIVSVSVSGATPGTPTLSASGRFLTFPTVLPTTGVTVTVTYTAVRPVPRNTLQMTVYYRAAAPQMARTQLTTGSLALTPRLVSDGLYTIKAGSGSPDETYPFAYAHVQTGGVFPTTSGLSSYTGESDLSASATIVTSDFVTTAGFLRLPIYVPMVASPEAFSLSRAVNDIDVENRAYFLTVGSGYLPNAYARNLLSPARHKNVLPVLAELAADCALGPKGTLLLVLLVRQANFDAINGVFTSTNTSTTTTTAAVFRVKGHLLAGRN